MCYDPLYIPTQYIMFTSSPCGVIILPIYILLHCILLLLCIILFSIFATVPENQLRLGGSLTCERFIEKKKKKMHITLFQRLDQYIFIDM